MKRIKIGAERAFKIIASPTWFAWSRVLSFPQLVSLKILYDQYPGQHLGFKQESMTREQIQDAKSCNSMIAMIPQNDKKHVRV